MPVFESFSTQIRFYRHAEGKIGLLVMIYFGGLGSFNSFLIIGY